MTVLKTEHKGWLVFIGILIVLTSSSILYATGGTMTEYNYDVTIVSIGSEDDVGTNELLDPRNMSVVSSDEIVNYDNLTSDEKELIDNTLKRQLLQTVIEHKQSNDKKLNISTGVRYVNIGDDIYHVDMEETESYKVFNFRSLAYVFFAIVTSIILYVELYLDD